MSARRTLAATVLVALFLATLAVAGWAAEHAPTVAALVFALIAIGVVLWRLCEDGES